jgi:hypothetical protein
MESRPVPPERPRESAAPQTPFRRALETSTASSAGGSAPSFSSNAFTR